MNVVIGGNNYGGLGFGMIHYCWIDGVFPFSSFFYFIAGADEVVLVLKGPGGGSFWVKFIGFINLIWENVPN